MAKLPDKPDKPEKPDRPAPARRREGAGSARRAPAPWSFWVRVAVSVALVWHLFVLFLWPFSIPKSSPLVRKIAGSSWVRWYSDNLYQSVGYDFFGPDPPKSNRRVEYVVYNEDGSEAKRGVFPDLATQWPRVWYHRHMMLCDQGDGTTLPWLAPEEAQKVILQSFGRSLLKRGGGARAELTLVEKVLLVPSDVINKEDPEDPKFKLPPISVTVTADQLDSPFVPLPAPPAGAEEILPGES